MRLSIPLHPGIIAALAAALLFGASTPMAKWLLGGVAHLSPLLLAGLLYLGSGLGLGLTRTIRDRGWRTPALQRREWIRLLLAILFGGVLAPVLLMIGLRNTSAVSASLLLNLEGVLTAVFAWLVFHENTDRRVVIGMLAIVAGAVVLGWPAGGPETAMPIGALAITAACLCWAIDNNLTRAVAGGDAVFIAASKGLIAGLVNVAAALLLGASLPATLSLAATLLVGLLGYGISLVLFVLALRSLGTARTAAYFSTAPFMGAVLAMLVFGDPAPPLLWPAALLMGLGVWLHLSERHSHPHVHPPLTHRHPHVHDAHHQHPHPAGWDGREPHSHEHHHPALQHEHPHYPDLHHQHHH
jgi:Permeases of the drug/metabolite transporter (DMT) superfamily